jgi:tetratricopeptide (TPR) repeat protein
LPPLGGSQISAPAKSQGGPHSLGRARLILPAYVLRGRTEEALQGLAAWQELEHGPWQPVWATYVYGRTGRRAEAERAFREIAPAIGEIRLDPTLLYVTAHLGLGENDQAIAWLEKACLERSTVLATIKADPIFAPLRGDPRLTELLRCAGFSPR